MLVAAARRAEEREEQRAETENIRFGTIAATIVNAQGGKKEGGAWFTWRDFFGASDDDDEPDPEVLKERFLELVRNRRREKAG